MRYLLDTCVVSETISRNPDPTVSAWLRRIVCVSTEVADEWGRRIAQAEMNGLKRPSVDSLIAVSAVSEGLALATRNVKDMSNLGVTIFNPWDGQYTRDLA